MNKLIVLVALLACALNVSAFDVEVYYQKMFFIYFFRGLNEDSSDPNSLCEGSVENFAVTMTNFEFGLTVNPMQQIDAAFQLNTLFFTAYSYCYIDTLLIMISNAFQTISGFMDFAIALFFVIIDNDDSVKLDDCF